MAFYAQYTNAAGPGAWATGLVAVSCFAVAIIALFRGEKEITKSDWATFIGALMIMPVWYFTKNPLIAIILIMLIDLCGYYPTFRKSYYKPHEESIIVYIMGVLQVSISICAMENYYLVNILYPIFIMFINTSFVCLVICRRKAQKD
jgi:hypothetical protein